MADTLSCRRHAAGAGPIEHLRVRETGEGKVQMRSRFRTIALRLPCYCAWRLHRYDACASMPVTSSWPSGASALTSRTPKIHAKDCEECTELERGRSGRIDRFERVISIDSDVSEELRGKIAEIAGKCPVNARASGEDKNSCEVRCPVTGR